MPHCLESPTALVLQLNTLRKLNTYLLWGKNFLISWSVNAPEVAIPFPSSLLSRRKMSSLLWLSYALGLLTPGSPGSPRSSGSHSLVMKSGKLSHSLLIIIPALTALLAHSSTIPRLLSFSKFLFDPFPYLFLSSLLLKRSQIETHTTKISLAPPPSYPSIHTILVLYLPSTKTMISIIKDFLTNRPVDSLIILYLSRPHPPHLPSLPSYSASFRKGTSHYLSHSHELPR